jgi:quinol monooxygenase YgiN
MQIVLVHVHVKSEFTEAFKQASIENASNSVKEEGIARFDVVWKSTKPQMLLRHIKKLPTIPTGVMPWQK